MGYVTYSLLICLLIRYVMKRQSRGAQFTILLMAILSMIVWMVSLYYSFQLIDAPVLLILIKIIGMPYLYF